MYAKVLVYYMKIALTRVSQNCQRCRVHVLDHRIGTIEGGVMHVLPPALTMPNFRRGVADLNRMIRFISIRRRVRSGMVSGIVDMPMGLSIMG